MNSFFLLRKSLHFTVFFNFADFDDTLCTETVTFRSADRREIVFISAPGGWSIITVSLFGSRANIGLFGIGFFVVIPFKNGCWDSEII